MSLDILIKQFLCRLFINLIIPWKKIDHIRIIKTNLLWLSLCSEHLSQLFLFFLLSLFYKHVVTPLSLSPSIFTLNIFASSLFVDCILLLLFIFLIILLFRVFVANWCQALIIRVILLLLSYFFSDTNSGLLWEYFFIIVWLKLNFRLFLRK